jgi:hypothetical protein
MPALDILKQRDMAAMALRLNRQIIDEDVRGCRWVVEYRSKRTDVHADYLRTLRLLTEAQALADKLGMQDCPLAHPIPPLEIWRDDFRWDDVLARTNPPFATAA